MALREPIAVLRIHYPNNIRVEPMKNVIAITLLLALGTVAQAKLAPVEPQPVAISPDDLAIAMGAAGATFEQDYFRAPQPVHAAGRGLPCRLQLRIFDKTRLAQWCH
jgi:hypothetical protein